MKDKNYVKFELFSFTSTFAKALIEIFIALFLFKNGFSLTLIILFYFFVNVFSIPFSYYFVKLGEKFSYIAVMIIGVSSFVVLQIVLSVCWPSVLFAILLAVLYALYRRGYWVARRFYLTNIMPQKKSSVKNSFVLAFSELATLLAGYVGALILNEFSIVVLTVISSILLFISVIPIFSIKIENKETKIEFFANLKKCDKKQIVVFSFYEINNLLSFIFPIYVAIYIKNTYTAAGTLNALSSLAIILFILIYGRIINNKKNFFITTTILVLLISTLKIFVFNYYFLMVVYFVEGIVRRVQSQSADKIYYENRNGIDNTNYNLIYQIVECFGRAVATLPLIFINNVRIWVILVVVVMLLGLITYIIMAKKDRKKY